LIIGKKKYALEEACDDESLEMNTDDDKMLKFKTESREGHSGGGGAL